MSNLNKRLDPEVAQYEANQYFDCQEIIDILHSAGLTPDQVTQLIALRHARALNDFTVLLARAVKLMEGMQPVQVLAGNSPPLHIKL